MIAHSLAVAVAEQKLETIHRRVIEHGVGKNT